mgnify:CR=1 FL=1
MKASKTIPWPHFDVWESKLAASSGPATSGGCVLWTGCTSTAGYGVISVIWSDGRRRTVGVHRLLLMCSLRSTQPPLGCEASHLCHQKLCINPQHVIWEPGWSNQSRKSCKQYSVCLGHGSHPKCLNMQGNYILMDILSHFSSLKSQTLFLKPRTQSLKPQI